MYGCGAGCAETTQQHPQAHYPTQKNAHIVKCIVTSPVALAGPGKVRRFGRAVLGPRFRAGWLVGRSKGPEQAGEPGMRAVVLVIAEQAELFAVSVELV